MTGDVNSPVAILDKELAKYPSYTIETFELCDCCGARFAIGLGRDIIAKLENYRSFLDIYDPVQATLEAGLMAKRPRVRV